VAVLTADAQGASAEPLDSAARARLRKKALDWLSAERDGWSKYLASGTSEARSVSRKIFEQWKKNTDLTAIRDPAAIKKLPPEEQEAWRALWSDVDALLAKATGAK
jgi:hypothetical protein